MDDANLEEGEKARLVLGVKICFNTTSKVLLANLTSLREEGREGERGGEQKSGRERFKMMMMKVTQNESSIHSEVSLRQAHMQDYIEGVDLKKKTQ